MSKKVTTTLDNITTVFKAPVAKTTGKATEVKAVVTSVKLLEGEAAIVKAVKQSQVKGKALFDLWHTIACSLLNHVDKHGDIRQIKPFLDTLKDTRQRKDAMRFFEKYGKLTYNLKSKELEHDSVKSTNMTEALANPFYMGAVNDKSEYVPLDLDGAIKTLIKRITKAKEHGDKLDEVKVKTILRLVA